MKFFVNGKGFTNALDCVKYVASLNGGGCVEANIAGTPEGNETNEDLQKALEAAMAELGFTSNTEVSVDQEETEKLRAFMRDNAPEGDTISLLAAAALMEQFDQTLANSKPNNCSPSCFYGDKGRCTFLQSIEESGITGEYDACREQILDMAAETNDSNIDAAGALAVDMVLDLLNREPRPKLFATCFVHLMRPLLTALLNLEKEKNDGKGSDE